MPEDRIGPQSVSPYVCPQCGAESHHPTDAAEGYCARCHAFTGLRRLSPGVYDDGAGGLHIVASELLADNGIADTPENQDMIERAARRLFAGLSQGYSIERQHEDEWRHPITGHGPDCGCVSCVSGSGPS